MFRAVSHLFKVHDIHVTGQMTAEPPRSRSKTGKRKVISLRFKVKVIQAYEAALGPAKTFYAIGKAFGVQTGQVSRWVKDKTLIASRATVNPSACTVNPGRAVTKPDVEAAVLDYFQTLQDDDIAISTYMLIVYALSIDPSFHGGESGALTRWVYNFMQRNNLAIRRPTRQAQNRSGHLVDIMHDFAAALRERFEPFGTLGNVTKRFFVNMDETPVPFQPKIKTTIAKKGAVSARKYGTKLPPFVVFKGVPGARIESSLDCVVPEGMFAACQHKAWMDEALTEKWFQTVWKPHVVGTEASLLLWDDFACHKTAGINRSLASVGTESEIIPGGFTCLLQPLDVAINKPFKDRIRKMYMMWAAKNMLGKDKIKSPGRETVLQWIHASWSEITPEMIQNAFRACDMQ
ncbi:hypothetical protein AaE_013543 [Aphanomyces astaci]|uniref:HTH CENPB-type domain-containing protein n=1 Tax=Aphanomyces astaci TaxID=112090 RepID=A0A6A4Z6R1_APHAT|nr:hypothetical protein AaE_013543 [Aphanomyces astaci]